MSDQRTVGVAIIGCGNIAGPYCKDLLTYPEIKLLGCADVDTSRAVVLAESISVRAYSSPEELLADPAVELVVNLTIHHAHRDVTTMALSAGKNVYSEKPLAMSYSDAAGLVQLAQEKGLRLGCSPFTLMGEAQQTTWKILREGQLGQVRLAYAEVNWGRIESWHPAPQGFYEVGPLFDVGVYPLTILTAIFGPARRVSAFGAILHPDRVTKEGVPFTIAAPDFVVANLEFDGGVVARLTTDFYVAGASTRQTGIEFHGDSGSLHLKSWVDFDSQLSYAPFNKPFEEVGLVGQPWHGIPWGRGVWETVNAMLEDRPHRFTADQAAHITEILAATAQSAAEGHPVELTSTFTPPAPMPWAV